MKNRRIYLLLMFFVMSFVSTMLYGKDYTKDITITLGQTITLYPAHDTGIGSARDLHVGYSYQSSSAVFSGDFSVVQNTSSFDLTPTKTGVYTFKGIAYYTPLGSTSNISHTCLYTITVVELVSVEIPSSVVLQIGTTQDISAKLYQSGATSVLSWVSDNPNIASVEVKSSSSTGSGLLVSSGGTVNPVTKNADVIIAAKSIGSARITCTASNGVSAQCVVTVNPNYATQISLSHGEGEIEVNKTMQLTANVLPSNVTNGAVSWSSSDESVAIVSTTGLVVGASAGWASITATTVDGSNLSASCLIHVVPPTVLATSLAFDVAELELTQGDNATLTPALQPSNVSSTALTWKSSDESIATVDDTGVITTHKIGRAVITTTTTDGTNLTASCNVKVKSKSVSEFENVVYFNDALVLKNNTAILALQMKNVAEVTAIQFDLILPEGITLVKNVENTAYDITFEEERADVTTHTLNSALQEDGSLRVLCYSTANELFLGNEGTVLYFPINVGDLQNGTYDLILQNMVLTDKNGVKTNVETIGSILNVVEATPGDANGDSEVDVADIVNIANHILGSSAEGFLVEAADFDSDGTVDVADIVNIANHILGGNTGVSALSRAVTFATRSVTGSYSLEVLPFTLETEGSKTLTLDLYNPGVEFTAFQCDIYLPDGLTIDKNRRGTAYNFTFNTDTERTDASYHTLSSALQSDGAVRVLCYSTASEIFLGEDGALLNIPVTADASLESGVYEFSIANTVLTYVNGEKVKPENYKGSIVVGDGGEVKDIKLYGRYTSDVLGDFSESLAGNTGITGINLTEAIFVHSTSTLTTGNPNTLIYLNEGDALVNESNVVCGGECKHLVLTDGFKFDVSERFTALQANYARQLSVGKYGTIVLPFVPDAATLSNYAFYKLNDMGDDAVTFTEVDEVETGVPYLYCLKAGTVGDKNITGGIGVVSATLDNVTIGSCQMIGSYVHETIDCSSSLESFYAYSAAGNSMNHITVQLTVNPFRAFIKKAYGMVTSRMRIYIEDPKGIREISVDDIEDSYSNEIYDLQGRPVANPVEGQIYIIKGQKSVY